MTTNTLRNVARVLSLLLGFGVISILNPLMGLSGASFSLEYFFWSAAMGTAIWGFGAILLIFCTFGGSKRETRTEEFYRPILGYMGDLTWAVDNNGVSDVRIPHAEYVIGKLSCVVYRRTECRDVIKPGILNQLALGDTTEWEYWGEPVDRIELTEFDYYNIVANLTE